eukprot:44036-Eustigmatos_ZCMA.PRE.1
MDAFGPTYCTQDAVGATPCHCGKPKCRKMGVEACMSRRSSASMALRRCQRRVPLSAVLD